MSKDSNEQWVNRPIVDVTSFGDNEKTFAYAPKLVKKKMIHNYTWAYRIKRFFNKYFTWSK